MDSCHKLRRRQIAVVCRMHSLSWSAGLRVLTRNGALMIGEGLWGRLHSTTVVFIQTDLHFVKRAKVGTRRLEVKKASQIMVMSWQPTAMSTASTGQSKLLKEYKTQDSEFSSW